MPIASFLVSCAEGSLGKITAYLGDQGQYSILGIENNTVAVLSDTASPEEEYELAKDLSIQPGVRGINILVHHVEDSLTQKNRSLPRFLAGGKIHESI